MDTDAGIDVKRQSPRCSGCQQRLRVEIELFYSVQVQFSACLDSLAMGLTVPTAISEVLMAIDPTVALVFAHNTPRYLATDVDPNDLQRLIARIDRWDDWSRIWCDEASRHEALAQKAAKRSRKVTASDANLRASIYYHYAKHLFAHEPDQYLAAHQCVVQCYQAAAAMFDPPIERVAIFFAGTTMIGNLRRPHSVQRPAIAILLPGLDACKEELHAWSDAFVRRGVATLAIDGPGQGETAFKLPITTAWGKVIGAVLDVLEQQTSR